MALLSAVVKTPQLVQKKHVPQIVSMFHHKIPLSQYQKKKHTYRTSSSAFAAIDTPVSSRPNTILNLNISFESFYRVILVYNNWTNDKEIARVLKKTVPLVGTVNNAIHIVTSARSYGKAIVVTVIKKEAEQYVRDLRKQKLEAELEEA